MGIFYIVLGRFVKYLGEKNVSCLFYNIIKIYFKWIKKLNVKMMSRLKKNY